MTDKQMIDDQECERVGINLNQTVYVALSDRAKAAYYDQSHEMNKQFIAKGLYTRLATKKAEDESGFSKFQLWELMEFFDKEWAGSDLPTLDGRIYFNKSDLSPLNEDEEGESE